MSRFLVLYVEDNEDDVILAKEYLPVEEFPLVWAPSAHAARKHLDNRRFDVVLLDHGLPDTNSLLFLDEIRAEHPDLPVIVLTGRDDEALAISVHQKGAAMHLRKEEMRARLRSALVEAVSRRSESHVPQAYVWPKRLSDHAEHLSAVLLSMMSDGCLLIDVGSVVTYANDAAEQMADVPAHGLLGKSALTLFETETARDIADFLAGGREYSRREGRLANGCEVLLSMRILRDELGQDARCLIVVTDISEIAKSRDALRRINERLEEVDRAKSEFFAAVSHELRTPMAAIRGASENILDGLHGDAPEEQRKTLEIVLRNAKRLARLIDNLLDRSQIEAGTFRFRRAKIDLREPIRIAVEDLKGLFDQTKIRCVSEISDEPVIVDADPERMIQIGVNLLDNALRFAKSEVRATVARENGHAVLEIEDDGPGIPEAEREKIFNRFTSVSEYRDRSKTGLGLSIVHGIVAGHGGRISVERSDLLGGARFRVEL